jgi:serine/threonine protein kinase
MSFQGHLSAHNVLVEALSPPLVKVVDYGLDRATVVSWCPSQLPSRHVRARWLAPEALKRSIPVKWLKEKADVWSFGVTAWQILSNGALPFAAFNTEEAICNQVTTRRHIKQYCVLGGDVRRAEHAC